MQTIKFKELRETVGNNFIAKAVKDFPKRQYRYKSIGNIIYLLAKPEVTMLAISVVRKANPNKQIKVCILPFEIIERVGL